MFQLPALCPLSSAARHVMKGMLIFLAMPLCILLLASKQAESNQQSMHTIENIDFSDKNHLEVWINPNCTTYGMVSGRRLWYQSTYIKAIYDIEKNISPGINGKCVCLYNTRTKEYLTDLENDSNQGLRRNVSHLSDLNEILKLYRRYLLKNKAVKPTKSMSPLHGSIYAWVER